MHASRAGQIFLTNNDVKGIADDYFEEGIHSEQAICTAKRALNFNTVKIKRLENFLVKNILLI